MNRSMLLRHHGDGPGRGDRADAQVLRERLGVLFARVHHVQHRYVHPKLEKMGLSRGQPPIIMKMDEGMHQHELAARVNLRPPTLTRILRHMEARGLVERRVDEDDQRSNRVYRTAAGRDAVASVRTVMAEEGREVFSVLTDDETRLLSGLLERVADRYESLVEARSE